MLDPHGDLIDTVIASIPVHRIKDVVLIDPSDSEFPISFNILSTHSDLEKELLASDLVFLFKRFSTSWGDQMNSVFANAIMAFVYNTKQYHIGDLRKFLIEQPYRHLILTTVTDADIVYYWQKEFPILKSTSIGPILTRLDAFLRPRVIRTMVCQTHSLNFQALMDGKKILLVKISQGLLGMENSYLLGAVLIAKLQQLAMARQAQAAGEHIPFYCYIDEFHHFITPSMSSILSGARKYRLGLILAHQDMQQVAKYDSDIANALVSNAGTRICFRLGDTDAKRMQEGFTSFTSEDLQNLSIGEAIIRVNRADDDCNILVMPYTPDTSINYKAQIISHSRATYSVPLAPSMEPASNEHPPTATTDIPNTRVPEPHLADTQVREHRYLQTFIKKLAEEYGYTAQLEVTTPDHTGQIDVVLEKDGVRTAVEISVTTSATRELHNIQKCLNAGYGKIVVCSPNAAKLKHIHQLTTTTLTTEDQQNRLGES